jgi:hypothetical protein
MILFDKPENQYPTHFWISAKPLKNEEKLGQFSQQYLIQRVIMKV